MNEYYLNLKKEYNKIYNTFCYQNCLNILLGGLNIENPEYYINKSMSLIVHKTDGFDLDIEFGIYARSLLPKYDSKVIRLFPESDYLTVFNENIDYIQQHDPIIVGVDSFHLSYLPYFHKSHGRHTIIMTGYDKVKSEVEIVDWMEPWFYRGYIPVDEFLNARNSLNESDGGMFAGNPVMNNWAKVIDKNGWDASLDEIIKYTLDLSLQQYYFAENHNDAYYGINALEYIKDMINYLEDQPVDIQSMYLDKLHKGFFRINRRREFWKYFLSSIHICEGFENPDLVIQKLDELIDYSEKYIYRLIKSIMRRKPGYSEDLSLRLNQMIDMEKELGGLLYSYTSHA
ncbi:MAG: hypothetical protein J5517_06530 [Eubacterium sp.]|nr:hypothetical protein [Eubacterium sp.]